MARNLGRTILYGIIAVMGVAGFVVGVLLGPFIHGILLGIEQVSSYIDRNSGP